MLTHAHTEETDYKDFTERIVVPDGGQYMLLPGQACLAITRETVKLPPTLCGLLEGRSRFARLGLFVHITASFINPGINNRQVLEIFNSSNHALALHPGTRICQLVLMTVDGAPAYAGRFGRQSSL
jgi:dCTP deaminase